MSSLYVISGKDQGKRFDLQAPVLGVGRDRSNAIQLHDTEISRRHAELRDSIDGYSLVDLDSSNGTYVNNEQIQRRVLRNGDRVQIGRCVLLFTGSEKSSSDVLASEVDIIASPSASLSGSRIVKTITQEEGSQIFGDSAVLESPWIARAKSNLQIMYRTALAVSHTLDIDQLLHRITELIFEWVDCDRGCIMLMDQEIDDLQPRVTKNRKGIDPTENIEISRTILDYVMDQKEGVITSDARDDERWDPGGSIVNMGVREAICVPMQGRYGIVGVIYIDTFTPPGRLVQRRMAQNKFTEEHLKLMIAIGHQAALAVEDTSYYSAMVQAERLAAMGQTIATLSHHIKNILQGIRGGSYLIEEGLKSDETDVIRRGWAIVDKNQERISNLVLDMLTFSKEREPDTVLANINEVTADVIEMMQARAEAAKVELLWQPQDAIPEFTFDPDAMHRAILNVVTNAIDACEKQSDGRVVVSTEHDTNKRLAVVTIKDNGEGIQPADLPRIFSVFESGKGARGTGLGLPVSQKILREHNGEVHVESEPGKGSCFTLEFPALLQETPTNSDTLTGVEMESERPT
ncbi:MAG: FHA domain-containing protein [Planctomycetes bacterium]|nr:FHA domain-containing protein [Planctomycetota bacterium]